jgi:hypothetical protein
MATATPTRHIQPAARPATRGPITEGADAHSKALLVEGKKNAMVKHWQPVLAKCKEIPRKKMGLMASLLENQHKAWDPKQRSVLFEDVTTTGNFADFTRFALPLIRKSYSKLISDSLVGVQPMSQPASLIFYIRYRYALSKGQTVAGTQIMRQNTSNSYAKQNGWALDPYYSSQTVKDEPLTFDVSANTVTGTLQYRPILAGTVVVNIYEGDPNNSTCDNASPLIQTTFDSTGAVDVFQKGGETDVAGLNFDMSSSFDHATGTVSLIITGGSLPGDAVARVSYEYDLEANPFQPELTMSIDSDSVAAVTRKLKTSWSLEAAQDLKAVHNIDAESTLTDLMADEMVAEIDREIINDLINAASIRATHDFANAPGSSVNFTDRNIALLYKVLEVANIIHRTTLRGPANWMVSSADIASKFEQLNDFRGSDVLAEDGLDIGIMNAGTIQGKLKLYKDPLFPNCKILMGFKGNSVLDAGYFYAPYIPLLSTPTVLDPNSFTPNKGIMTRYGKKLIEDGGLYYATITVGNL